ncbi:MAG: L-threonylcarbamoyladenylate synthase [Chloroherpetonaceae bacterium]
METKLTKSPKLAAQFLLRGGVVAFPTETVYGLGANLFDETHVQKIFLAKGRPSDNPLIAHVSNFYDAELLVKEIPRAAEQLMEVFFPGALTIILPKSKYVPDVVSAGMETIGIRMPSHKLTQTFLKECGTPVAAPSANLSGKPSSTSWKAVREDFDGKIECILKGDASQFGLESTVVDCSVSPLVVLRTGAISLEELQRVVPETMLGTSDSHHAPKSPGMKYRHYAPEATVKLIEDFSDVDFAQAFIGISKPPQPFAHQKICEGLSDYARALYAFFRDCDAHGLKTIYCQSVPKHGLGLALMDRIQKAARK